MKKIMKIFMVILMVSFLTVPLVAACTSQVQNDGCAKPVPHRETPEQSREDNGNGNGNYVLKLSVDLNSITTIPTTITLKLSLTLVSETRESWLHFWWHPIWITKSNPVNGALISFYSCDQNGTSLQLLGTAVTNKNGIATFPYTINSFHNDYWFVAQYTSPDGKGHECRT